MSFNGTPTPNTSLMAGASIGPQLARDPMTGQLFCVIAPHQASMPYFLPRGTTFNPPIVQPSFIQQHLGHPQHQLQLGPPQQHIQFHSQVNTPQLPSTTPSKPNPERQLSNSHSSNKTRSKALLKDRTNAFLKSIKGADCISHYIEEQLIIETTRPINEHDVRSPSKKKDRKKNRNDEIKHIRNEMPNWSVGDVVKFIQGHEDISQYADKFADDDIDGKALLLMIDRNLNLQMLASMFKHGPAMKIEAALSKYKLSEQSDEQKN